MIKKLFVLCAASAVAACSGPINRLALPSVESELQLRALVSSVMIRSVVLPSYAAAEEIPVETPEGLILSNDDVLWADDPERSVTLVLMRNISSILDADIGPDPWPFVGLPDVAVEVHVERIIAGTDGVFWLSGQFFVGGDGIDFPNRVRAFEITKPVDATSLRAVSNAQAAALLELAEQISRTLAR